MTGLVPFQPATPSIGGKTFDTGVVGGAQRPDELKYNGGVFQFIKGGNVISQVSGEVNVVILGATPAVASRIYYKPPYDPNNTAPPECWSTDGNTPDAAAPGPSTLPVRPTGCDACPMNAENSGGAPGTKACSYSRYLVVSHPPVEGHPPHPWLMRLNGGTLFGATNNEAQNWFSFVGTKRAGGLIKFLDANGYAGRHHQIVVTIKPDLQQGANNKLQFSPVGLLDANSLPVIEDFIEGNLDRIRDLTALSFTPRTAGTVGNAGVGTAQTASAPLAGGTQQSSATTHSGLGATSPLQNPAPMAGPGNAAPAQTMGAPDPQQTTAAQQAAPGAQMAPPGQQMYTAEQIAAMQAQIAAQQGGHPAAQVAGNATTFAGPGAPGQAQPAGPGTQQTDPHAVEAQLGAIVGGMTGPQG